MSEDLHKFLLSELRDHLQQIQNIYMDNDHETDRMEYHTDKAIAIVDKLAGNERGEGDPI